MKLAYAFCTIASLVTATGSVAVQPKRVDILVGVANGQIRAPDTAAPGWMRMRVEEDGAGHIAVIFRLPANIPDSAIAALRGVLDTAVATPRGVKALGGPEVGDTGEVVVRLTPGRYLIGCVRRGPDGHRHLSGDEWKVLRVGRRNADAAHAKAPPASHIVRMVDFAFTGEEKWKAGPQVVRVENNGSQDHQFRVVKLRPGATAKDWVSAPNPGAFAVPVVGLSRISAGEAAYLPLDLPAGSYVAHCLATDPTTGKQHVMLGMYKVILVE